ncbi:MAG: DUF2760 domain-containing protein, partial [Terrimicrobiaceae bacterium]
MKAQLITIGFCLLGINSAAVYFPDKNLTLTAQTLSAALGMVCVFLSTRKHSAKPITPPVTQPIAPPPAPPRPEAEIAAFLALLQEHGRLVDFAKEDITSATDQQLGAAARVVHSGCRKVLNDYFEISPLRTETEGNPVTLESGYDAPAHRLLGSVPANPPYAGKLVHPGWITKSIKLPRVTGTTDKRPWPVLAPAEIEIK